MGRIFVLGNASIDTTLRVPRLPAPGETLMASGVLRSAGGKGLNQAVIAARCGVAVRFCAALGVEPEARLIRDALAAEGLESVSLLNVGAPTDISTLLVDGAGENCIISTGACADGLTTEAALEFIAGMDEDDLLLMQGNLTEAVTVAAAQAAPGRVMLNTAPLRWDYARVLPVCDVVVANRLEAWEITGLGGADAAVALRIGGGVGIVTLGGQGCVVADSDPVVVSPVAVDAVDTTGAGDVFCGVLAAGLARARDVMDAVGWAQRAAALSATREGCFGSFPSPSELAHLLNG